MDDVVITIIHASKMARSACEVTDYALGVGERIEICERESCVRQQYLPKDG